MKRLVIYIVWFNPSSRYLLGLESEQLKRLENKLRYFVEQFALAIGGVLSEDYEVDIHIITGAADEKVKSSIEKVVSVLKNKKLSVLLKSINLSYGEGENVETKVIKIGELSSVKARSVFIEHSNDELTKNAKIVDNYVKNHVKNAIFYQYIHENEGIKLDRVDRQFGINNTILNIRNDYLSARKIITAEALVSDIYNLSFAGLEKDENGGAVIYLDDAASVCYRKIKDMPLSLSRDGHKLKDIIFALKTAHKMSYIKDKNN